MQYFHLALTLFALACTSLAAPEPIPEHPMPCRKTTDIKVESTKQYKDTQLVTGWSCDATAAECELGAGKSYKVTSKLTIGGGLDLGKIIDKVLGSSGLGLKVGWSLSKTDASSIEVHQTCPVGYQCGMIATATKMIAKGTQQDRSTGGDCLDGPYKPEPYEADVAVTKPTNGMDAGTAADVEFHVCTLIDTKKSDKMAVCPA
ncbi:MAG: hypothetical protein M1835_007905 [Candelina submexicana]|nr:MAG: hypothetical protein M1835_007905 [Candelina submexicana]